MASALLLRQAGLGGKLGGRGRFGWTTLFLAVEQLRGCALIETERVDGHLHYRAHQTVLAYGERYLSENKTFEAEARQRWSQYYIDYLDTYLKRDKPEAPYWNCLLGRDLEIGLLDEGLRRIEAAIRILENVDPSDPGVKGAGTRFQSEILLENGPAGEGRGNSR